MGNSLSEVATAHVNVLLVSGYELGRQPLGLASAAAHLIAAGHEVACLDLSVQRLNRRLVRAAEFVGISIPMHTAIRLGVHWAARIRELNPTAHLGFYGLYASLNEDYLFGSGADSVIGGEFDEPLAALVDRLAAGDTGPISGVSRPDHRSAPYLGRTRFRVPARHLLPPLDQYARLAIGGEERLAGAVEASRGCAHRCRHCPITPVYAGRLRIAAAEVVLADIAQLVDLGARHMTFADPDFLNGVRHSLAIARAMHDQFPALTFDITTKIEHILEHRAVIGELAALGCVFIQSAVESLSDTVLGHLEKGHTRADVEAALAIVRTAGSALRPTFVPFTPWTTPADYLDLLDFIEQNDLIYHVEPIQLAIRLLVPPGSSLLGTPGLTPYLGAFDPANFVWHWAHPDPRLDRLPATVTAIVEQAGRDGEDPARTFDRIRAAALELAGGPALRPRAPVAVAPPAVRPPRLTEAWYC